MKTKEESVRAAIVKTQRVEECVYEDCDGRGWWAVPFPPVALGPYTRRSSALRAAAIAIAKAEEGR